MNGGCYAFRDCGPGAAVVGVACLALFTHWEGRERERERERENESAIVT